jgi:hypothetical protein
MKYYEIIDGQRYDRALLEMADSFMGKSSASVISEAEARAIAAAIHDSNRVTQIEKSTLAYIRRNYAFTNTAEQWWDQNIQITENLAQRIFDIVQSAGVPGLRVEVNRRNLSEQVALDNNRISFEESLRRALHSLLNEGEDVESPRSLVIEVFALSPESTPDFEAVVFDHLARFFNTGTLTLVPIYDPEDEASWDRIPVALPESRERVEDNWIFALSLPDLSDHVYWAIVDRTGEKPAYNYGFN